MKILHETLPYTATILTTRDQVIIVYVSCDMDQPISAGIRSVILIKYALQNIRV
jgi:hypothetical protein